MVDSFQVGCFTITNLVSNGTLPVLEGDILEMLLTEHTVGPVLIA